MAITSTGSPTLIIVWRQGAVVHGRTVAIGGDVASTLGGFAAECAGTLDVDAPLYDPDAPPEGDPQRTAPRAEAYDTGLLEALGMAGSHPQAHKEDYSRALICWAVVLGEGADQTIYVHKNSPVRLARAPLLAGLVNESLQKISESVLAFDPHFDVVITPERIFILDVKDFEGLFKDSDAVLGRTQEWAAELTSRLPSTDGSTEVLETVLRRNGVLRRKVTSILRRPYFATLDPEIVRSRLAGHGLDEDLYLVEGKLNFSEATIETLVRFLNEDLFKGDFSEEQFAASGKQRLSSN